RLLPVLEVLVALRRVHLRLPALVLTPVLPEVLLAVPQPGGETRGVGSAERGGLGNLRADHRDPKQVRLELHQQVVADHAAVYLERVQVNARVGIRRLDDLAALVGGRLERRPGDMTRGDVPG